MKIEIKIIYEGKAADDSVTISVDSLIEGEMPNEERVEEAAKQVMDAVADVMELKPEPEPKKPKLNDRKMSKNIDFTGFLMEELN